MTTGLEARVMGGIEMGEWRVGVGAGVDGVWVSFLPPLESGSVRTNSDRKKHKLKYRFEFWKNGLGLGFGVGLGVGWRWGGGGVGWGDHFLF